MQIIFQDPDASLNPRMTVEQSLAIPLQVHEPALTRAGRRDRVEHALHRVGLSPLPPTAIRMNSPAASASASASRAR